MKKRIILPVIGLIAAVLLSACGAKKTAPPILLPEPEDVTSISVERGGVTAGSEEAEWISEVLSLLADMEATDKPTISDAPKAEDYITINLHCADGTGKTVFFYEERGKEYVEQPYQGIYRPDPALGEALTALLASAEQ